MPKSGSKEDSVFSASNVIAIIALIVAIFALPFFENIFPSYDTKVSVFHKNALISDGRLGKGPQLFLGLNFSNLGNRAITISDAHIKFALESHDSSVNECESSKFTWMGVPWLSFLKENSRVNALPILIPAGMPHSELVIFEPANVLTSDELQSRDEYRIFSCLSLRYLDSGMNKYEKNIPVGYIEFTRDRVVNVDWSSELSQVISLY